MKRLRSVYHLMVPLALALLVPLHSSPALAQGQALPPIKVDLPPPPNFNVQNAPEQYPSGEMSVYGLRKHMSKYLDKDVYPFRQEGEERVTYLIEPTRIHGA